MNGQNELLCIYIQVYMYGYLITGPCKFCNRTYICLMTTVITSMFSSTLSNLTRLLSMFTILLLLNRQQHREERKEMEDSQSEKQYK